jgi:hypothetical protein
MKNFKALLIVLTLAASAFAQGPAGPNVTLSSGTGAASSIVCNDASVGKIYTQSTAGGLTNVCQQTSAGVYGWVTAPAVSGGTLVIATGKTATINNTLTFAGTDSTTMTFPSTSGTVVTLGATQTLTAKTLTAPVIATITNTGTETLPSTTGGLPVVIACGATSGTAACANTATITLTPGYTSSATFQCLGQDQTTRANPVQVVPASATTFVVTNTTGASDAVAWICAGN